MKLLKNLIIKNLKLNKKRTIVSIIGIVLSVALITAVSSMYMSGVNSLTKYVKSTRGDFHAILKDVPEKDLPTLQNNRKLEDVSISKNIGYAKVDSKNKFKPYVFIKSVNKNSYSSLGVKLLEGNLPKNSKEIVIPKHLKTNGKVEYKTGDIISLDVGTRYDAEGDILNQDNPYAIGENGKLIEEIKDNVKKEYKVVGIVDRPVNSIEPFSSAGYTMFTTIDSLEYKGNYDVYLTVKKDNLKDVYKILDNIVGVDSDLLYKVCNPELATAKDSEELNKQLIEAKYKLEIDCRLIELEINPIKASGISGLSNIVVVVIVIIIFTSVFVIRNSFDISITEKIRQYGMLRSIGATKKQIKKTVFKEASILGWIAIPLGVLLGLLATYILIILSNYLIGSQFIEGLLLEFHFSLPAIIVSIILGIITIYLSAISSARKAAKVSPIDSIRNSEEFKKEEKKVKTPKIISKLFGIGGVISFKNLKRSKKKYRTTTISIIVSVTIFIALSSFTILMFGASKDVFEGSDYNISISFEDISKDSYKKLKEISKFDNIEEFSIVRKSYVKISSKYLSKKFIEFSQQDLDKNEDYYLAVASVGDEEFKSYLKLINQNPEGFKHKGILIDYFEYNGMNEKGKQVVDNFRVFNINKDDLIKVKEDDKGGKAVEISVGVISKKYPFGLDKGSTSDILILSDEHFDEIAKPKYMDLYIYSKNNEKLVKDIEEYLKDENFHLFDRSKHVKEMKNISLLVSIFLYGFITVITLIGITNIFNTITTNMELRKREFATLKAIGMTTKEFNKMIRLESLFMGVKSLIIGVPLGVGLSLLIQYFAYKGRDIPYNIPSLAIGISIIAVFLLIIAIMKYSINKINKQNVIETIRNENI